MRGIAEARANRGANAREGLGKEKHLAIDFKESAYGDARDEARNLNV